MVNLNKSTSSVIDFLQSTQIKSAFVPYLPGNNGDDLMVLGLDRLLNEYRVKRLSEPGKAHWAIIRGNGAMNDFWRNALDTFAYLLKEYPHIPIAVMPSSYHFQNTDFAALLANRSARCVLFARERASYDLLKSMKLPDSVEVLLDHDMALCLRGSRYISELQTIRRDSRRDYVLVVERSDLEHPNNSKPLAVSTRYKIDHPILAMAKAVIREPRRVITRTRWRQHGTYCLEPLSPAFEQESRTFLSSLGPDIQKLPWKSADVSDPLKYSFKDFSILVAQAAAVVTTRLHVSLLPAMLNVPTGIRTGRYGKIAGVYEYSLSDQSGIHLISPP